MIRYSLQCERRHEFEIWFKNSADYDSQSKRGLVTCPACGSAKVEKTLMAPSLGRGTRKGARATLPEAITRTANERFVGSFMRLNRSVKLFTIPSSVKNDE